MRLSLPLTGVLQASLPSQPKAFSPPPSGRPSALGSGQHPPWAPGTVGSVPRVEEHTLSPFHDPGLRGSPASLPGVSSHRQDYRDARCGEGQGCLGTLGGCVVPLCSQANERSRQAERFITDPYRFLL